MENEGRVYIGIDPGISGAVAAITEAGDLIAAHHIPTLQAKGKRREVNVGALRTLVTGMIGHGRVKGMIGHGRVMGAVERVGARPGQGVVSMYRFGKACGLLEGLLLGLGVPYITPLPRSWQAAMLKDVEGETPKIRAVIAASRLWGNLDLTLKKDHNKADAALIAMYARQEHLQSIGRGD